jgi:hypothetical protein
MKLPAFKNQLLVKKQEFTSELNIFTSKVKTRQKNKNKTKQKQNKQNKIRINRKYWILYQD